MRDDAEGAFDLRPAKDDPDRVVVHVRGAWIIDRAASLSRELERVESADARLYCFELADLQVLDTAGAWLLTSFCRRLEEGGAEIRLEDVRQDHRALLEQVQSNADAVQPQDDAGAQTPALPVRGALGGLGLAASEKGREFVSFVNFLGLMACCVGRLVTGRDRLPPAPLVHHMQRVWLDALPIVGLLSFLIGIVLAWQGAIQLRRFGAEALATNLTGLAMVREVGVLLPALVVAGRSGSAFTAEIGTMRVSQEVDAMVAVGIDPLAVLVVPRMLALMLTFPLLAFFGELAGLAGGGVIAWLSLDMSPMGYIARLEESLNLNDFVVGIAKAPVFGTLVALVGCYQGLQASGSAKEVGERTTRSVVQSVFLVLVIGALLSVLFGLLEF